MKSIKNGKLPMWHLGLFQVRRNCTVLRRCFILMLNSFVFNRCWWKIPGVSVTVGEQLVSLFYSSWIWILLEIHESNQKCERTYKYFSFNYKVSIFRKVYFSWNRQRSLGWKSIAHSSTSLITGTCTCTCINK